MSGMLRGACGKCHAKFAGGVCRHRRGEKRLLLLRQCKSRFRCGEKQRKTEGRGYAAIAGGEGCSRHEGRGADRAFFLSGEISGAPA